MVLASGLRLPLLLLLHGLVTLLRMLAVHAACRLRPVATSPTAKMVLLIAGTQCY